MKNGIELNLMTSDTKLKQKESTEISPEPQKTSKITIAFIIFALLIGVFINSELEMFNTADILLQR
jgi:hypothetical protein